MGPVIRPVRPGSLDAAWNVRPTTGPMEKAWLARGMPKAEAVRRIFPGRAAEISNVYFDWLGRQQIVVVDGDLVNQPGRSVGLTGQESKLATRVLERFDAALRSFSRNPM